MAEAVFLAELKEEACWGGSQDNSDDTERGPCGGICALCPNRARHAATFAALENCLDEDRATGLR